MHVDINPNALNILDKLKQNQSLSQFELNFICDEIDRLDSGHLRAATKINQSWEVNTKAKASILAYLRTQQATLIPEFPGCFDKVPLKFQNWSADDFQRHAIRAVPGSVVRKGAYIGRHVVLMPCFINIGAHVGDYTMIDAHATVGSCAQVGSHCHISGGAGIGGVLEPEGSLPTVIEDHCFIGARSEIAEGVIIGQGSVIAMGVYLSASTKIFNTQDQSITYGHIPAYSVVVPGTLPYKGGQIYCAMIIKNVTESTRKKTSINELLR
ncbi:MAG: 2,3,4,5-tetrahydropyridine-2,6-dicarboxylate N-succinyltransferase [Gammaproteobacteria bacterium]|nr:2,3,4,5-tetrahydropyridine-2,6-dicarboxylate N-succinyltransferase [Gammaproteobacteria bacterium]